MKTALLLCFAFGSTALAQTSTPAPKAKAAPTAPAAKKRAGGGPEQPELKFHLPPPPVLSPQEALKSFTLPEGFKIELVASEPMIEAPVALSWDDQGRMYVCEMRGYMQDMDGGGEDKPIGRVSRLEDTDGDGAMDKATVFADDLLMPRAVMAMGDGAVISEPPNFVWHRDTDGDGVADKKELIASDYARAGGQPEHMANSPIWAMDNWIWSSNHNARYRFDKGKFRKEATTGFGQWGRAQDDWGRQYFNYNSDLLRTNLVPFDYYQRNTRLDNRTGANNQVMKVQTAWPGHPTPGVNRGYMMEDATGKGGTLRADGSLKSVTAVCGATIYRGDLFPKEYLGNAFVPEPAGNFVKRLILDEKDGMVSGRNAMDGKEFLTSTDERFRPVNAYSGPDGALYIVDLARGILQHKGFLTYYLAANIEARKLADPDNLGRIYRIVPDGAQPKTVKLPRDSGAMVPLLAHANGWVRDTAQRTLVERSDAAVVDAVKKLATDGETPQARLHALWTLEGLNALSTDLLRARLADADVKVRAAAVRLADKALLPDLLKLTSDPSAELRMHVAFKLSGEQGAEIEDALIAMLKHGGTPLLPEAIVSGMAGRELEFLERLAREPAADVEKLAKSDLFKTLAGCVMKERRGARIVRLLDFAATQPADGPGQLAILNSFAGKAPPKGKPAPTANPIKLDAEPTALARLQASSNAKTKALVANVEQQLTWPGKPGAVAAVVAPLTTEQKILFEKGKALYATVCTGCHQPTGAGLAGLAPPLLNSEWAIGPIDRPIRIVLQGVTGPIEVAGTMWQLEMPGLPLSDEDVAAVLTYIRREWEHTASPVSPAEVAKVRAATKSRSKSWTADELRKPLKAG